jgi:Fic family protein
MPTLDPIKLPATVIPMGTGWLLGACMESRGKQDLWIRRKPEVLEVMRELAVIQSVESSNRIEGITVPRHRLRPIVIGNARPRDRSEEELAGYRSALSWIFSRKNKVKITPDVILHLHALSQGGSSGDAGEWKQRDNEIIQLLPNGERHIRFIPVSARATPDAVETLCRKYHNINLREHFPSPLSVATFIFDFLCIHPFRDGNGRVSRLLTSLLLQSHGFQLARYISLERLVEERKEEYYDSLELCSQKWHAGKNEIIPWWNFFLGMLRSGYIEFERQLNTAEARPAKSEMVSRTVLGQVDIFTLADVAAQVPMASPQLIKKVLAELKKKNRVKLEGRGRGARWEVVR